MNRDVFEEEKGTVPFSLPGPQTFPEDVLRIVEPVLPVVKVTEVQVGDHPFPVLPEGLDAFIKELQRDGFRQSAQHLENAQPETFTWQADKGFAFTTTAPLEREMKEEKGTVPFSLPWQRTEIPWAPQ